MNITDKTFGISEVALKILDLLGQREVSFVPEGDFSVYFRTYPWYNGREHGIAIVMGRYFKESITVVFGEARRSDQIFIDVFLMPNGVDQPTVQHFSEEAYRNRRFFNYNQESEAVDLIIDIFTQDYNKGKL
jgi:hypothetical protein